MNTLDALFSWFLATTVRGALLALVVLALRAALRRRLPARWRYASWLPMILVFVAPSLPQTRWSLENCFVRPAPPVVSVSLEKDTAIKAAPTFAVTTSLAPLAPTTSTTYAPKEASIVDRHHLLELGWLTGVVGMLVFMLTAYAFTMRRIRRGAVDSEPSVQNLLSGAARACGLRRLPRVLVSTEVRSPAVAGFFRPTLLLPAGFPGAFTENEAHLILLHELTHLKRYDLVQNWLFGVLQALHWCNPVLWLAFAKIREDREAACDAQVLNMAGGDQRAAYGHALLELGGVVASPGLSLGFVGIFERSSGMRARIRDIAVHRRSHPAWSALGVALVLALALVGATRAQNVGETPAQPAESAASSESESSEKISEIRHKLISITISEINFRKATVRDALNYLAYRSVQLDPAKKGIHISTDKAPASSLTKPITLSLSNIPLTEALRYVTELAGLRFKVDGHGVNLLPRDIQPEYTTTEWPWNAESKAALRYTDGSDLKECLLSNGILFPPGASYQISPDGKMLIVKNTDTAAFVLDEIIHPGPPMKPNSNVPNYINPIQNKLASIIIPKLDLRDATVSEVIDYLRVRSAQLDPAKEGVNLVLDLPLSAPAADPITVSRQNISLGDALKYVADVGNLKLVIESMAVKIVPPDYGRDIFFTRIWLVTPEMASAFGFKEQAPGKIKYVLAAKGVAFPPGTSVSYVEKSNRLIMTNNVENLDLLNSLLYPVAPAAKAEAPEAAEAQSK